MISSLRSTSQVEGTHAFLPQLEKDLEIPLQIVLMLDSPGVTREQCRAPLAIRIETGLPWRHERIHEFPIVTREKPHMSRPSWRKTRRLPRHREMRPSSIAPNQVESREAPANSTVFLTSHSHPEKLPEVTVTSRGNPGFPAATQKGPRNSPFNAS